MLTFFSGPPRKRVRQDNTSGPFTQQEQLQEQEHRSLAQNSQLSNETGVELPLSSSGAAGNSQGSVDDATLPAGAALSDATSEHHTVSLQAQPQLQLHEPDASAPAPGVHGPSHQEHSEHDGAGDAGQQDPGRDHLGIDMPRGDEILGMFIESVFVVRVYTDK